MEMLAAWNVMAVVVGHGGGSGVVPSHKGWSIQSGTILSTLRSVLILSLT